MSPRVAAVVAMARNGVIGRDGAMPWRLSGDLKRFRELTMNKPMIMGRKTLESIGKVLDGRDTIVLSSRDALSVPGAQRVADPQEALRLAVRLAEARGSDEIVIAGGGEIYRLFMDRLDRLYVTIVEAEPDGDATFPSIEPNLWRQVSEAHHPAGKTDSAATRFTVWDRL